MAIDTRMNGVIHAAFKRDLVRIAMLTEQPEQLTDERLRAVGDHTVWLMETLHEHHVTEDERLFPVVRANNAEAGPLLDAMESEHAAIAAAVTTLEQVGRRAQGGDRDAIPALAEAVAGLRTVLDPHLEHEERSFSPIVPQSMTEEQWAYFEKSNSQGRTPPEMAFMGHWLLDNLDPRGMEAVKAAVPAVPRFILVNFLGGRYRKRRAACWGGTPAMAVPAERLLDD